MECRDGVRERGPLVPIAGDRGGSGAGVGLWVHAGVHFWAVGRSIERYTGRPSHGPGQRLLAHWWVDGQRPVPRRLGRWVDRQRPVAQVFWAMGRSAAPTSAVSRPPGSPRLAFFGVPLAAWAKTRDLVSIPVRLLRTQPMFPFVHL